MHHQLEFAETQRTKPSHAISRAVRAHVGIRIAAEQRSRGVHVLPPGSCSIEQSRGISARRIDCVTGLIKA